MTGGTAAAGTDLPDLALAAGRRVVRALGDDSVATAESLTAGLVSATLARIPGVSTNLRGGVVAYCNAVKVEVLRVPAELIAGGGPVQEAVAAEMARGAGHLLRARFAVATTGVAGPGDCDGHPAGTVVVAAYDVVSGRTLSRQLALGGDRDAVRWGATVSALDTLAELAEQTRAASR